MSEISKEAAEKMQEYIRKNGFADDQRMLEVAFALATHYGEAISALSCKMYEATAAAQKVTIRAAEAAATPSFKDVAIAVHGTMKQSNDLVPSTVGKIVKQIGADTTLKNAKRDGACFAWVPQGDTCNYCMMMAALGWQKAGDGTIKGNHAEHIHSNCDCQYMIDFKGDMKIKGYDPEWLREKIMLMVGNGENSTFEEFLNRNGNELKRAVKEYNSAVQRAKKYLKEHANEWIKTLTEKEIKYITKYTYNPGDEKPERLFERLNSMLRGDTEFDQELEDIANEISEGLKKFELDQNIICYRRTDLDYTSGIEVGESFIIKQFTSTSIDDGATIRGDVLTVYYVKKGTSGAYVEPLSAFPKQKEFLIDRDIYATVKSRKGNVIEVEVG